MYDQQTVRKTQLRLLTMAKKIRDILEAEHIPYFITYGTLLGAVRHKGFIPWDDDFDFYLFKDSYEQALSALRKGLPSDMFLEWYDSEPKYFHAWARVKDLHSVCDNSMFPQDMAYAHQGLNVDLYITQLVKESEEDLYLAEQHYAYIERRRKLGLITEEEYCRRMDKITPVIQKARQKSQESDEGERSIYAFMSTYSNDFMYPEDLFPLKPYQFEDTYFLGPQNGEIFLSRCYGNYMQLPPEEKQVPHNSSVIFLDSEQT